MTFFKEMTLQEITALSCFAQMEGQFVSSASTNWLEDKKHLSLAQLQAENPTWHSEDIILGLSRLHDIASGGGQYVYPLAEGPHLIHLPAREKRHAAFALLMAGGAYGAVCTLGESLPVAARLNEMGMDCFCLNYRTADRDSFTEGLMPKPLDDLAAAWHFIKSREKHFGVDAGTYLTCGFSAGGHLCAMWGTGHRGARHYGIPNPQLVMLAYPLINLENLQGPMAEMLQTGMLGAGFSREKITEYSANRHVDAGYPPVYLCLSKDDATVPGKDALDFEGALQAAGVRYCIKRVSSGGHGYGLGSATPAKGWVDRAICFMEGEG